MSSTKYFIFGVNRGPPECCFSKDMRGITFWNIIPKMNNLWSSWPLHQKFFFISPSQIQIWYIGFNELQINHSKIHWKYVYISFMDHYKTHVYSPFRKFRPFNMIMVFKNHFNLQFQKPFFMVIKCWVAQNLKLFHWACQFVYTDFW